MSDSELLQKSLETLEIHATPEQVEQFMAYRRLLLEWNAKMNLTAITEPREILLKHFADCAPMTRYVGNRVLDVGTGAGFPGIPIKILRSDLHLHLLDSLNKRIAFLQALTAELGLDRVAFLHARAEDAARTNLRERFDTVVSRAVAALPVLAEYCLPFVEPGGTFIAMKGQDPEGEIAAAEKLITALGGGNALIKHVEIPFTDITHSLIMIEKLRSTPEKYPRGKKRIGS